MADTGLLIATAFLGFLGVLLFVLLLRRMSPKDAPPVPPPAAATNKVVVKEEPKGPPCKIFFGSQTGTAESFATKLAKELKGRGMAPTCVDMEDYHADGMDLLADEPFVVYLMATNGEGDPTDNAIGFYEWIKDKKEREEDELSKVAFCCFGLGNRQYEHYNKMGKEFNKHMLRLGASIVGEYGEGDDDVDLEGDYQAWMAATIPAICAKFGLECGAAQPAELEYEFQTHDASAKVHPQSTNSIIDNQKWAPATLTAMRELQDVSKSGRSTLHVEVSGPEGCSYTKGPYGYAPGDHIAVRCENNPKLVAALGTRLKAQLGSVISLTAKPGSVCPKYRFPSPAPLKDVLSKYLDICTPPTQEVLRNLARFASDADEAAALLALGSPEGKAKYASTVTGPCLTVLELLDLFPSLQPPIGAVLELLPRLGTRFYSISSSPAHPSAQGSIHLTVAIVRYSGGEGTSGDREGVASTWFERMRTGRSMEIYCCKADFKLPPSPQTPVLMIGPGTGLAPFRGFIQERQEQHRGAGGAGMGEMVMVFGCRSQQYDYIYQRELEAAKADGTLSQLLLAFSRDQKEKVYVQHLIDQNQALVHRMLGQDQGHVYICGDAKDMAADVTKSLQKAFEVQDGISATEAEALIKQLKTEKRFQLDVWA